MSHNSFFPRFIPIIALAALCLECGGGAQAAPSDISLQVRLEAKHGAMGALVTYYRPLRIELGARPAETLKAEPKYQSNKPLYGVLNAGDGKDSQITVVVDEIDEEQSRIYVDLNNDEDLTNDGDGKWTSSSSTNHRLSKALVQLDYGSGEQPYTFNFYRFKTRLREHVFFYRDSYRAGELTIGDQRYQIAILDDNADGRFDDLANGALIVDLNQDGKLAGGSASAEHHKLGEPFNIHGAQLEIASLSADGLNLTLRRSSANVDMRSYIDVGHAAPNFTGKDLEGKSVDLRTAAARSKFILLDFWASWCGPCRDEYPYLRRLHAKYRDHGLQIIGVNLDTSLPKAVEAATNEMLDYAHVFDGKGWKNEVAVSYRVNGIPATFLLDRDLNILAKGLRGAALEKRMRELLGSGDEAAAAAVDKKAKARAEATPAKAEKPAAKASAPASAPPKAAQSSMTKENEKGDKLTILGFEPKAPATLNRGQSLTVRFSYELASAEKCLIWARPASDGKRTPGYSASGSKIYPKGSGEGSGHFTFSNAAEINQVEIYMVDAAKRSSRLVQLFGDADVKWEGAAIAADKPTAPASRAPKPKSALIGLAAPEIEFFQLEDGARKTLSEFKGKVVVVDFWASWCGPCQTPMAKMQTYREKHSNWGDKVELIALSIDNTKAAAANHLSKKGWDKTYNVWAGDGGFRAPAPTAYGVRGIPSAIIIDQSGKVVEVGHPMALDIPKLVDGLLETK